MVAAASIGELVVAPPTGFFSVALAFCLTWWLSSFVVGGLDLDAPDSGTQGGTYHGSARGPGLRSSRSSSSAAPRGPRRPGRPRSTRRLRRRERAATAPVPASLRWTVGATAGWVTSLALSATVRGAVADGPIQVALLGGAAVVAVSAMRGAAARFSALVAPMFTTPEAPSREGLVGSIGRVRSLDVDDRSGDAKLATGPSSGAIVRVRATPGRFVQGDLVQLIAYDADAEAYVVDEVDDLIAPGSGDRPS